MLCRTCSYPLWNIAARQCPECGSPFKPSDFDFTPNAVRFCCPHCEQPYYGTDARGHLVPASFTCVACQVPISMDDCVLLPAEGLTEKQTQAHYHPWLERRRIGWFAGFFKTMGMAHVAPGRLLALTPAESSATDAFFFGLTANAIYFLFGVSPLAISIVFGGVSMVGMMLGFWLALVVGWTVWLLLWTATAHLLLGSQRGPFLSTWQAFCYSSGAMALNAVPCLGVYVSPGSIWWLVSACIAIKEAKRVSSGRAAFAVITPPVVVIGGLIVLWLAFVFGTIARTPGGFPPVPAPAPTSINTASAVNAAAIAHALRSYGSTHGQFPAHGSLLLANSTLQPWHFSIKTGVDSPPALPGLTVSDAFLSPVTQLERAVEDFNTSHPNLIAHRVGEVVFTYHAIPVVDTPAGLWLAIYWPVRSAPDPLEPVTVIYGDGRVQSFDYLELPLKLQQQNQARASVNLPPLPDPNSVTVEAPAVRTDHQPTPDPADAEPPP